MHMQNEKSSSLYNQVSQSLNFTHFHKKFSRFKYYSSTSRSSTCSLNALSSAVRTSLTPWTTTLSLKNTSEKNTGTLLRIKTPSDVVTVTAVPSKNVGNPDPSVRSRHATMYSPKLPMRFITKSPERTLRFCPDTAQLHSEKRSHGVWMDQSKASWLCPLIKLQKKKNQNY